MIDVLRGEYEGQSIAVLGSAPSVTSFERREDMVIGINGAASLLRKGDLFFSCDEIINTRSYFNDMSEGIQCLVRPHAAIYSPRLYPDETIRTKFIGEYERFIQEILSENPKMYQKVMNDPEILVKTIGETIALKQGGPWVVFPADYSPRAQTIDDLFADGSLPDPTFPHLIMREIFQYLPESVISRNQRHLFYNGTSTSGAIQLANLMGAREIHLYGVEFSNQTHDGRATGTNYFYDAKKGETGMTNESQRGIMDEVIRKIREQGTEVFSHGPTNLKNSIRAD